MNLYIFLKLQKLFTNSLNESLVYQQNIPLFKIPGMLLHSAVDIPEKVVSIGKILAATHTGPLNISTFFGKGKIIYPDSILLLCTKNFHSL